MVHSRAFTLPVKPDDQYAPYVMMPYMDMINHHYHYQADWISQPIWGGKLEIIARREISKGEELFASFGPRANDNLFLYYGRMHCVSQIHGRIFTSEDWRDESFIHMVVAELQTCTI
jgi:hypothetical protein